MLGEASGPIQASRAPRLCQTQLLWLSPTSGRGSANTGKFSTSSVHSANIDSAHGSQAPGRGWRTPANQTGEDACSDGANSQDQGEA